MVKLFNKLKENPFIATIIAIVLGLIVLFGSKYPANYIQELLSENIEFDFYTRNVIFKLFILIFSLIIIWLINGSFKGYGFTKPTNIKYFKSFLISLGIIVGAFIFGNIIFNGLLRVALKMGLPEKTFPSTTILEAILTIWIWSSLCEEILTRGLIQGYIQKHKSIRFLRLSLPVWISGLFFGAMHLSLLKAGMDELFVAFIVFNTTVLGLLAAYYREKSGSLYPAIFIHMLANIIGYLPAILMGS